MARKKQVIDWENKTGWNKYRVFYTGGIFDSTDIEAPNKTYARRWVQGELNPGYKVTRIVEL